MTPRHIFITGGASGIGFGIAQHLGSLGHSILIADISLERAQQAVSILAEQNISAKAIQLDVGDAQQIEGLAESILPDKVDILINNAGIQHVSRLEDFPSNKWQALINVMLIGPALLSKAFLPNMRSNNFGRIINVGSLHSVVASPY